MPESIPIENPSEYGTNRTETVINTPGGTDVSCGITGQERRQISCNAGNNINMNNKTFSMFAPNQRQSLVFGKDYTTIGGDSFEFCKKNTEKKSYGDFTIITGNSNFFSDEISSLYIENNRPLATLRNNSSIGNKGVGNNSGVKVSSSRSNEQEVLKETAKNAIAIEKQMGEGGNMRIISCKHIYFQAGQRAVNYDSGVINKSGKQITKKYTTNPKSTKVSRQTKRETSAPIYEANDTSSSMPFGDITLNAMGKMNLTTGSGGFSMQSAGETRIASTGRCSIGGAEVAIGSNNSQAAGRVTVKADMDMFMQTGTTVTIVTPNIIGNASDQVLFDTPMVHHTLDTYIHRDLEVGGNLLVHGDIRCYGKIEADKDIIAGFSSSPISLLKHYHTQGAGDDLGAGGITTKPTGNKGSIGSPNYSS